MAEKPVYGGYIAGVQPGEPPPIEDDDEAMAGGARPGSFGNFRSGGGFFGGGGGGGFGGGGGSILTGAPPTGGSDAAGRIPGTTNPASTVTGSLGDIGGAISGITGQQLEALRKQYPTEYFATLQQLLLNTQRRAGGDISDLLPELQTRNAEAGIAGGYSGSQMENTKLLRDLGLTRYGVEEQALKDLGLIQSGTPTVKPYDPSGIIAGIINAQAQADINRAAPDPEAAYQRALENARRGGGSGGGAPGGGVRPATLGGGGGGGSVDDILKRYGSGLGGYGPPIIARGTRQGALPDADWNPITFGEGGNYGEGFGGGATRGGTIDLDSGVIGSDLGEDFNSLGNFSNGFGDYYDDFGDYEDYGGYDDYEGSYDYGGGYEDYGGGDFYEEDYF